MLDHFGSFWIIPYVSTSIFRPSCIPALLHLRRHGHRRTGRRTGSRGSRGRGRQGAGHQEGLRKGLPGKQKLGWIYKAKCE